MITIVWTDYLKYRAELRGFDLQRIEEIVRYSNERYFDNETYRMIAVGNHKSQLVVIPYEITGSNEITPVTIHATSRQQISYRLQSGRFKNEYSKAFVF